MTTMVDRFLQVQFATLAIPGMHYDTGGGRCDPEHSHYADCSGMQCYAMRKIGLPLPYGCMTSFTIEAWGRRVGAMRSISEASHTPGMWVGWTRSNGGHIAVSTGDGRVFAARGRHVHPNVGFSPFWASGWEWAMWPPGLSRTAIQQRLPGPTTPSEARAMGMHAAIIVPGSHEQSSAFAKKIGWQNRYPFVSADMAADGTWSLIGHNGAKILNRGAVAFMGMSILKLGKLFGPIEAVSVPSSGASRGKIVFLASDGGEFTVSVKNEYV